MIEPVKLWVIGMSPSCASPESVHRSEAPDSRPAYEKGRCGSDISSGVAKRRQIGRRGRELQVGAAHGKGGSELDMRDVAGQAEGRTARCARLELDPGDVQGLRRAAQLELTRNRAEIGQRPVEPGRETRRGGRARELERDAFERSCRAGAHRSRSRR